jgi:methylated-DNA-protein-cysteine methyltransferase-like protein
MSNTYQKIYTVVRRIPRGRVATYGQVAELAGIAGQPRQVGYALGALTGDEGIPWQRVVNAKGEISPRADPQVEKLQRTMLESEGIEFDGKGRILLERFRWKPRGPVNSPNIDPQKAKSPVGPEANR